MWQEDVLLTLQDLNHQTEIDSANPYFIIGVGQTKINLVPLVNSFNPQELIDLQAAYASRNQLLVHLWEDVWATRREQVLSRIHSFVHNNQTIHGRKIKIKTIDGNLAKSFFNEHHLQGFARCKLYLGLHLKEDLLAVGGFGGVRLMTRKIPQQHSIELIRFATKSGYTIVGGLGKLLRHVSELFDVDDIMTYADRDWSIGKGYAKLGFEPPSETEPIKMLVDRGTLKRYPSRQTTRKTSSNFEPSLNESDFIEVFNTGNLKYHYRIKH